MRVYGGGGNCGTWWVFLIAVIGQACTLGCAWEHQALPVRTPMILPQCGQSLVGAVNLKFHMQMDSTTVANQELVKESFLSPDTTPLLSIDCV